MSFGDLWNRTLVYFGIAEEDEDYYEDDEIYEPGESLEQSYRERPNVRRLTPRNVEVSAEQRAQLLERGGFYNQA